MQAVEDRQRAQQAIGDATLSTVNALVATIEKRDPYTAGHQSRVADFAARIGEELGWDDFRLQGLRLGALIHDIGKINIPAEILNRPGELTDPEFEIIKSHPQVGADILEHTDFPWPIREMVLQHHERIDGSGYPSGLHGQDILEEAKILCVADVVEAMTAHRPYRPALGIEKGLLEIEQGRGVIYDAEIADAAVRLIRDRSFEWTD